MGFYWFMELCLNRPYSYSRTGTSVEWRLLLGDIFKKELMSFACERTPPICLSTKVVPVRTRRSLMTWVVKIPIAKEIFVLNRNSDVLIPPC